MKSRLVNLLLLSLMIVRFLLGTLWGTLLACLALYYLTRHLTTLGTFSLSELILWIDGQSAETKALVLSSALTIVGFLVAFQAATRNWRDQTKATIRIQAAAEIDSIYTRIGRLINSLEICANMHLKLLQMIAARGDAGEIARDLQYALGLSDKFEKDRQELWQLHIESLSLLGRYSGIFLAIYKGVEKINAINESVASVAAAAGIRFPDGRLMQSLNYVQDYVHLVNEGLLTELSSRCKKAGPFVAGASGELKGHITAPVGELTLGTFLNFMRHGAAIVRAADALRTGKEVDVDDLDGRKK